MPQWVDDQSSKLLSLLATVPGKKTLVLDRTLSGLISHLASFSELRDHGAESIKWLEPNIAIEARVIIILRSSLEVLETACELVKTKQCDYTFVLVPRRTPLVDATLTAHGILADVTIKVLDVLHWQVGADIRVDTPTEGIAEIYAVGEALVKIQLAHGLLGRVLGKGANAERLSRHLSQRRAALLLEDKVELEEDGKFGDCIILDRQVDMITPLLTQLTYEGLLYESFNISNSVLELPSNIPNTERKIALDNKDDIFMDLRDDNFAIVGEKLKRIATSLSAELDSRHQMKTTSQLKAFVTHIPNLQSSQRQLKVHIDLAEAILAKSKGNLFRAALELEQSLFGGAAEVEVMNQFEILLAQALPKAKALRLICLWSQIHNGLKSKDYEHVSTLLMHAFGYELQLQLVTLRQKGLFVIRSAATEKGRGAWYGFSRNWKLVPDNLDEGTPSDLSYLYSGYAPLSLRVLQGYLQSGFFEKASGMTALAIPTNVRAIDTMMRNLRGPTVDLKQLSGKRRHHDGRPLIIVMLGGYTAAEASGVRFLAKTLSREVVLLGGDIVTGNQLVDTL